MNVYTCTDFSGHWPVGTAAVIVAPDIKAARAKLHEALKANGLVQDVATCTLRKLDTTQADCIILNDGDY